MISEDWIQEYILLAFRIDKVVQTVHASPFVEEYYGPPAWRSQAESEPALSPEDLVRQSIALTDALPLQSFTSQRTIYLAKQLKAMETVCC